MALDLSPEGLNARIDALRTGFAGHQTLVRARNRAFLRAFSPEFDSRLGEMDQWTDDISTEEAGHARSSYNVTRPVVEMWAALEMGEFPAVRWQERFLPTPVPSMDEIQNAQRQQSYRTSKLVARQIATMREQTLTGHIRRSKLARHAFRAVRKKNIYGHSWLKTYPDDARQTFVVRSKGLDPSTIYPVWSMFEDDRLDAILVAYRRSVQSVNAEFPGVLKVSRDGLSLDGTGYYYQPSMDQKTDADRRYVWVEDYWALDATWEEEVTDGSGPIRSRVVNGVRINGNGERGKGGLVARVEYPGWRSVPYVPWEIENERDHLGFSDAGTMLPIQDSTNRFLSQQQDVIQGESRPRFKFRGDAERQMTFNDEEIISLDQDEDIEQIAVHLDVFPTQVHGQQLTQMTGRVTGLNASTWGEITQAQNSGRALAQAWKSVAARGLPRSYDNSDSIDLLFGMWLDWMELYDWDNARELYGGNRDFELDFPNQEPRDFTEVSLVAHNKLAAGTIDLQGAMEMQGERSPDEMIERVRADYMDAILHPEKSQSFLMLTRLRNQIAIEAQQAGIAAATAQAQLQQLAASAPGGAPSGAGTPDQQAGAATAARNEAAARAAPRLTEGQNVPASANGSGPNAGTKNQTQLGTLVQNGAPAQNRIIDRTVLNG